MIKQTLRLLSYPLITVPLAGIAVIEIGLMLMTGALLYLKSITEE